MGVIQKFICYTLAILLVISIGINVFYYFNKAILTAQNTSLNISVNQLRQDGIDKSKTITDQNKKIEDAAAKAATNKASIDDLAKKLSTQTEKNTELVQKLLNQPAPKTCEDAVKYLKDNIGIYVW